MTKSDKPGFDANRPRRTFRPKRLKTDLAKPRTELPEPPPAKDANRIAKVMARAGVASRREAEALIAEGRVSVNGAPIDSPALNVGRATALRWTASRCSAVSARACSCSTSPPAWSRPAPTPTSARPSTTCCLRICHGSSPSAGWT